MKKLAKLNFLFCALKYIYCAHISDKYLGNLISVQMEYEKETISCILLVLKTLYYDAFSQNCISLFKANKRSINLSII